MYKQCRTKYKDRNQGLVLVLHLIVIYWLMVTLNFALLNWFMKQNEFPYLPSASSRLLSNRCYLNFIIYTRIYKAKTNSKGFYCMTLALVFTLKADVAQPRPRFLVDRFHLPALACRPHKVVMTPLSRLAQRSFSGGIK